MFVKWRTYQRQHQHEKKDKYIQQPIIMHSYRPSKKIFAAGMGKEKADYVYNQVKNNGNLKRFQRPRQLTIMKLPAFSACMIMHLDAVNQILDRKKWWLIVDQYLDLLPKYIPEGWNICVDDKAIKKLRDSIESYVPRIDKKDLNLISKAEAMFADD
jgi:hypothetical protein